MTLLTKPVLTNILLMLTLDNVRSLNKHVFDILKDTVLPQNYFLDLTQMCCHLSCKCNLNEKNTKVLQ